MFHVERGLEAAGISAPPGFADKARTHLELVYKWNKVHDLTAVAPEDAVERHLVDSILPFIGLEAPTTLLDVGTGAGFPGIFLALWWPTTKVTLCEPLRKRRSFLELVCSRLGLDAEIVSEPVEKLSGTWEMVTSRATLPWPMLLSTSLPHAERLLVGLLGPEQAPESVENGERKQYTLPSGAKRVAIYVRKCST